MDIFFDNEFRSLIPPLHIDERKRLEGSLIAEGNRDPIIIWKEKQILLDGHNRYDICHAHNIPLKPPIELSFKDRDDAKIWILKNQLERRNLERYSYIALALKLDELLRPKAEANLRLSPGRPPHKGFPILENLLSPEQRINSVKEVAKIAHTSTGTVAKVKTIEKYATPEQKAQLVNGKESINKIYNDIKPIARKAESPYKEKTVEYITLDQWQKLDRNQTNEYLHPSTNGNRPLFNEQENESIEWALWSWNPITGCNTGCKYCYARDIADRFYPQKFIPSFYPQRLLAPINMKLPVEAKTNIGYRNVFTCSMSDMFGPWVPMEWIDAVMDSIKQAPQWNFLILTKWPENLIGRQYPSNVWLGTTVDCQSRVIKAENIFKQIKATVKFISCEPLSEPIIFNDIGIFDWLIIGGRSKTTALPEFRPPRQWINNLEQQAIKANCRIYEKQNLLERIKEYPQILPK